MNPNQPTTAGNAPVIDAPELPQSPGMRSLDKGLGVEPPAALFGAAAPAAEPSAPIDPLAPFTLPNGQTAQVVKGKGKHLMAAMRLSKSGGKGAADEGKMQFALLSQLTTLDGLKYPPEHYEEMDMEDVLALLERMGENFTSLAKT